MANLSVNKHVKRVRSNIYIVGKGPLQFPGL